MQDDIVASLASQLGAELITDEARRAERTPAPDSMDLYFQGMAWYNKGRNPADIDRARGFFERALALDPDNLDAALGKAVADFQVAVSYSVDDRSERLHSIEAQLESGAVTVAEQRRGALPDGQDPSPNQPSGPGY